jgi:NADH-quinone oxidoreductase subunit N
MTDSAGERTDIEDFRGLFWRRPWLAGVFTSMLMSLAGIPLTAGFIGKFFVLKAGVDATLWTLVIVLALSSAIGLFYYLRIVAVMLSSSPEASETEISRIRIPALGGIVLGVLTVALFYFGVYPGPLLEIIRSAALSGF